MVVTLDSGYCPASLDYNVSYCHKALENQSNKNVHEIYTEEFIFSFVSTRKKFHGMVIDEGNCAVQCVKSTKKFF
jgi:hypothetical protein